MNATVAYLVNVFKCIYMPQARFAACECCLLRDFVNGSNRIQCVLPALDKPTNVNERNCQAHGSYSLSVRTMLTHVYRSEKHNVARCFVYGNQSLHRLNNSVQRSRHLTACEARSTRLRICLQSNIRFSPCWVASCDRPSLQAIVLANRMHEVAPAQHR